MNPECKACWRPNGPNCQHRTGPLRSLLTGTDCTKYPGLSLGGGVTDCSYYKPATFWDDFWAGVWAGVSVGAFVTFIAVCLCILVWGVIS